MILEACQTSDLSEQPVFGSVGEAVEALQGLAARLEAEGLADGGDPTFQIGTTYSYLGQILVNAKQPQLGVEASRRAIEYLEKDPSEAARGNLSAALGSLANALTDLGRHAEALEAAEVGDLDQAEEQLLRGLSILEPLNVPDVGKIYADLTDVAEARGDVEAAAAWAAKRDTKREELRRLAGGDGGSSALPEKAAQAFLALAQTVYAARTSGGELPTEAAEVLAQLAGQAEPLASAGGFLRAVAEGGSPSVPAGLPEPLPKIFGGLLASLG